MPIDSNSIFEQELARRAIAFVKQSDDEYSVELHGGKINVNLANVRRNAERDADPDAIRRFVDHIVSTLPAEYPAWNEASKLLLFSAEPADQEFDDSIRTNVSDEVCRVLTLPDENQTRITWVTPKMCADWGVDVETASDAALANQDRLLDGIELELAEAAGEALGMVPLDSPYKASIIFAPSFRRFVEPKLGWPVMVVVPCRDFIYVVPDASPLLNRLGSVVVKEFKNSGYPISTEVFRISDDGIEAMGKFPT